MNSEELELSLRTEFESYLKDALASVRQEVSGLQEKIEAELDKHKSQLNSVFQDFAARLGNDQAIDPAFSESIVEHMRLARDEGARITATAMAEAEDMRLAQQEATPTANFSEIRDAIVDISAKTSQSAILKSLIQHSAKFTPRGAFFIIKNEHFVGWRAFGPEATAEDQAVREVYFPISSDTVLGQAARSMATAEGAYGTYSEDSAAYLNKLDFGQPDKMFAIPLVARGRGVAVLYADYGTHGMSVNVEALETLVSISGLTVELLAASQGAKTQQGTEGPVVPETANEYAEDLKPSAGVPEPAVAAPQEFAYTEPLVKEPEVEETEFTYAEEPVAKEPVAEFEAPPAVEGAYSWREPVQEEVQDIQPSAEDATGPYAPAVDQEVPAQQIPANDFSAPPAAYEFESTSEPAVEQAEVPVATPWEKAPFEAPQYEAPETAPEEKFETYESQNGSLDAYVPHSPEPIVETVAAQPVKTRFSDRNVDLPIEVAEDERRLHNDARRFARLLVSEVKLYNEQKVKEGRESKDLYDRLRDAIDRSREMYDKRVQPPVSSKFDYFHYELVSTLAEGDEQKLGERYPGANV